MQHRYSDSETWKMQIAMIICHQANIIHTYLDFKLFFSNFSCGWKTRRNHYQNKFKTAIMHKSSINQKSHQKFQLQKCMWFQDLSIPLTHFCFCSNLTNKWTETSQIAATPPFENANLAKQSVALRKIVLKSSNLLKKCKNSPNFHS